MNPGVIKEATKVAGHVVSGLKMQPALLALVALNGITLVFMFYALYWAANFRTNLLTMQFEYQKHVTELLSRCVVPR